MKKYFIVLIVLLIILFPSCSKDEKSEDNGELNIFTWDGYFPQEVLDGFTESTGIKLNFSHFESNEEMLTKLEAVNAGDYDIIIASDYIIDIARNKGGLLKELDKSLIPNFDNLEPGYLNQYFDPNNVYTMPYGPGTPLIVYDPSRVDFEIKGFNDLWNPKLKDSLVLIDDARVLIGMALLSMGESMNTQDVATIEKAGEKLIELKPNIRLLSYNNLQTAILSGEATAGYMFTTQSSSAISENPDLKIVYPEEGMGFGIDSMFIPLNAPNSNNAHTFMNYLLDPEVSAKVATGVMVPCVNKESAAFLPSWYTSNGALFIPSEELTKTEFITDVGSATEVFDRVWTNFKQTN